MLSAGVEKRMAKKKVTRSVESGLFSGAVTRFLTGESEPSRLKLEFDTEADKKAMERVLLPAKVNRLEAKLNEMLKASQPSKHRLKGLVVSVKKTNPSKASDHAWIALRVDLLLEKARPKQELKDVCPESWMKVQNPPRLLSGALQDPTLKPRVKCFISKAR
jgi:hypothetical protein